MAQVNEVLLNKRILFDIKTISRNYNGELIIREVQQDIIQVSKNISSRLFSLKRHIQKRKHYLKIIYRFTNTYNAKNGAPPEIYKKYGQLTLLHKL